MVRVLGDTQGIASHPEAGNDHGQPGLGGPSGPGLGKPQVDLPDDPITWLARALGG